MDKRSDMVSIRDEIAEAGREQDRLLAEHDHWMARRNAARAAPVSETPSPGLITKDYGGDATQPAPERAPGAFFGDYRDDMLARNLGIVIAELQREWRRERREYRNAIIRLQREAAGDRAEMRRERALLYDEIKTLRKRLDLNEQGRVDELPRKARERAKRHAT